MEAERAVEAACLAQFGTLRPVGAPVLRSDHGLIFQSRRFRQGLSGLSPAAGVHHALHAEHNGIIERCFRSLKEECVWQHVFQSFDDARRIIRYWMRWYNEERPHQVLGYQSPVQYRAQQSIRVA
jgi:putative transposase